MEEIDNKINYILRSLNQLESIDIVPILLKKGFNRHRANELVKFIKENNLAELDYSNELHLISVPESTDMVKLKNLYIKAKITVVGKKYLKDHQTFYEKLYYDWKRYLLFSLPIIFIPLLIKNIWSSDFGDENIDSITFTVFVHGPHGRDDLILKNQGKVTLELNSDKREASINEKGEATFKEIPIYFKNKEVQIFVNHSQPYKPVNPDSLYVLKDNEAVYLEAKLFDLDKVRGVIIDGETEFPLNNVRVSIKGSFTYTNKFGEFVLNIPEYNQSKFQKIRFFKENYSLRFVDSIPVHTKKEVEVSLIRKI